MKEQTMESEHTAERLYVGLPDHEDCIEIRSHDDHGEKLLASVGGDTDDHEADLAFAERLVSRYNALSGVSDPAGYIAARDAEVAGLKAERDHWKSNHDEMVRQKRMLQDRPDLADRAASIQSLQSQLAALTTERDAMREALTAIDTLEDAPSLHAGEMRTGLHCGVEDRDICDRYDAAEYGFEDAAERWAEWAKGIARAALAKKGEANENTRNSN